MRIRDIYNSLQLLVAAIIMQDHDETMALLEHLTGGQT